jgi:hypothetical protein
MVSLTMEDTKAQIRTQSDLSVIVASKDIKNVITWYHIHIYLIHELKEQVPCKKTWRP